MNPADIKNISRIASLRQGQNREDLSGVSIRQEYDPTNRNSMEGQSLRVSPALGKRYLALTIGVFAANRGYRVKEVGRGDTLGQDDEQSQHLIQKNPLGRALDFGWLGALRPASFSGFFFMKLIVHDFPFGTAFVYLL